MNKIRKFWKNNGTPFFFRFKFENIDIYIPADVCSKLDGIMFDSLRQLTCLDMLVDIFHVKMHLEQVSSSLVKDSVMYELFQCVLFVLRKANLVEGKEHVYEFENNCQPL